MNNPNGSITINGVDDKELVAILEIKVKHEQALDFNPQQLQPVLNNQTRQPIQPQTYNNAVFTWKSEDGLQAVREIVSMLLKIEKKEAAESA
ncbi:MAG: hypothetical protein ACRD3T_13930 [Terriglobia bacterium]